MNTVVRYKAPKVISTPIPVKADEISLVPEDLAEMHWHATESKLYYIKNVRKRADDPRNMILFADLRMVKGSFDKVIVHDHRIVGVHRKENCYFDLPVIKTSRIGPYRSLDHEYYLDDDRNICQRSDRKKIGRMEHVDDTPNAVIITPYNGAAGSITYILMAEAESRPHIEISAELRQNLEACIPDLDMILSDPQNGPSIIQALSLHFNDRMIAPEYQRRLKFKPGEFFSRTAYFLEKQKQVLLNVHGNAIILTLLQLFENAVTMAITQKAGGGPKMTIHKKRSAIPETLEDKIFDHVFNHMQATKVLRHFTVPAQHTPPERANTPVDTALTISTITPRPLEEHPGARAFNEEARIRKVFHALTEQQQQQLSKAKAILECLPGVRNRASVHALIKAADCNTRLILALSDHLQGKTWRPKIKLYASPLNLVHMTNRMFGPIIGETDTAYVKAVEQAIILVLTDVNYSSIPYKYKIDTPPRTRNKDEDHKRKAALIKVLENMRGDDLDPLDYFFIRVK